MGYEEKQTDHRHRPDSDRGDRAGLHRAVRARQSSEGRQVEGKHFLTFSQTTLHFIINTFSVLDNSPKHILEPSVLTHTHTHPQFYFSMTHISYGH